MMQQVLYIFIGGGLGSLARFGVGLGVRRFPEINFPLATLTANLLSCLVMGLVVGTLATRLPEPFWRYFIVIGFCGGFSTFSTFSFETLELIRKGQLLWATANVCISIFFCIALLALLIRKVPTT